MRRSSNTTNPKIRPAKMRRHTARRYRNAQLALNCRDELMVIADYRRSQETELLLGDSVA